MIKTSELTKILNRCVKSSKVYFKEEGTFYPMLVLLKKDGPLNVEKENSSILLIKNDEEDEACPQEYYAEDGEKINVSFILFRRTTTEDDKNLSLVSKELIKEYGPDAVCLITSVSSASEKEVMTLLYLSCYIKGSKDVLRMYIPYLNKGELDVSDKETTVDNDSINNTNYDVTFINSVWTYDEPFTHFFKNPYLA